MGEAHPDQDHVQRCDEGLVVESSAQHTLRIQADDFQQGLTGRKEKQGRHEHAVGIEQRSCHPPPGPHRPHQHRGQSKAQTVSNACVRRLLGNRDPEKTIERQMNAWKSTRLCRWNTDPAAHAIERPMLIDRRSRPAAVDASKGPPARSMTGGGESGGSRSSAA